jgi:hypothetical protein
MSIFSKLFGKKEDPSMPGVPDKASMMEMMKNPAMQNFAREMQSRLSRDDQKELMRLAMARDAAKIEAFLKSRIPDLEDMAKRSGIAE